MRFGILLGSGFRITGFHEDSIRLWKRGNRLRMRFSVRSYGLKLELKFYSRSSAFFTQHPLTFLPSSQACSDLCLVLKHFQTHTLEDLNSAVPEKNVCSIDITMNLVMVRVMVMVRVKVRVMNR